MPALVIVIVESRSSSTASVPGPRGVGQAPDARRRAPRPSAIRAAADDRDDEPVVGLHRDADVDAVEEDDLVALEPRVELGEPHDRGRDRADRVGDEARDVEAGEVAFLDEGDGGDLAVGARHLLDDRPPDPPHGDAPPVRLAPRQPGRRPRRSGRRGRCPGGRRARRRACARAGARPESRGRPRSGRTGRRRRAAPPPAPAVASSSTARRSCSPSAPITTSTAPTGATSPSSTRIFSTVPSRGEGISTVVLSVCTSTSG